MSKLSRHKAILELLDEGPVSNQEELQRLLRKRGFDAGQATLSRDIRELGLVKSAGGYALPGREGAAEADLPSVGRLVREFVTSVRAAQNLLVTKTSIGSAQPVAAALDGENWPEAIGTIAGDDTILIICEDRRSAGRLADRIQGMLA
ncbi:MAG: ArgR family transcriptional regulator [Acidobacteria bacterium 13_1_20CM_4_56_7]|jgi:transcriptional regulator of arginine metabolism|nr:MAG: ArgR family transcriptional regulator [Acidobacteria bacterium 13_1_20CM_4_56_7]PYV51450.1 MAG: ArgR family transcriptional regulator [Acidobacteriota bacterium]